MAALREWAIKNFKVLNIKVEKYRWIDKWLPGYFDYAVEIYVRGKKFRGRGIDNKEETAFDKAIAESVERAVVWFSDLEYPWATSAYPDLEGAKERAYWELLGIDRTICHHLCRVKAKKISLDILDGKIDLDRFNFLLRKNRIYFELYEFRPTLDSKSVFAISYSPNSRIGGFISGFGTDKDIKRACLHAIFECLRTAVVAFFDDIKPERSIEYLKERREPRWHFWKAQEKASLDYLKKYIIPEEGEEIILKTEDISIKDCDFITLNNSKEIFFDIPLYFAQAKSDKLITPQFGEIILDPKTQKRLEAFNEDICEIELNIPHFYG